MKQNLHFGGQNSDSCLHMLGEVIAKATLSYTINNGDWGLQYFPPKTKFVLKPPLHILNLRCALL